MFDPYSEGIHYGICYAVGGILLACSKSIYLLRGKGLCESIQNVLSDHLYPVMKHFYSDGSGLLSDDDASIQRDEGSLNGVISVKVM